MINRYLIYHEDSVEDFKRSIIQSNVRWISQKACFIYYFAIEHYATCPTSIMLLCQRVLCYFAIEHYATLPSSIMLLCQRVLCYFANEYYATLPTSIMLLCYRALCYLPNEYYATLPSSIMLLGPGTYRPDLFLILPGTFFFIN